jgi:hypothetical protein
MRSFSASIAAVIGKRQFVWREHLDKAARSTAMLDVGPALATGGADDDAVGTPQAFLHLFRQARSVGIPRRQLFHAVPRAVAKLCGTDGGAEGQRCECTGHLTAPDVRLVNRLGAT